MKVIAKDELLSEKGKVLKKILSGSIVIYPTDTIYGLGCDATSDNAVKKIREIKGRFEKPFSVIAPGKEWIKNNCIVKREHAIWLERLPGPFTLILKLKNEKAVSKEVTNSGILGVRIPDNWFSEIISELEIPFVTTSVNKAGENHMTSIENLDKDIKTKVDFIIYEGEKKGSPSTIVDLTKDKPEVKER